MATPLRDRASGIAAFPDQHVREADSDRNGTNTDLPQRGFRRWLLDNREPIRSAESGDPNQWNAAPTPIGSPTTFRHLLTGVCRRPGGSVSLERPVPIRAKAPVPR